MKASAPVSPGEGVTALGPLSAASPFGERALLREGSGAPVFDRKQACQRRKHVPAAPQQGPLEEREGEESVI